MALLDVSEAFGPDFCDEYTIARRKESVSEYGRSVLALDSFPGFGMVAPASPNDLERLPDADVLNRWILVITMDELVITAPGYKPDLIVWQGQPYIVRHLASYQHFGAGFTSVLAESIGPDADGIPPQGAAAMPHWVVADYEFTPGLPINWAAIDEARVKLTGDLIPAFSGASDGQRCLLTLMQDDVGNRVVTLPSSVRYSSTLPSYVASIAPGATDRLAFVYHAGTTTYDLLGVQKGF